MQEDPTDDPLTMTVDGAGSNISLGHKQMINIARVVLRQPRILLANYAMSAVSLKQRYLLREMTFNWFKDSTSIMSGQDTIAYMKCNKIVRL